MDLHTYLCSGVVKKKECFFRSYQNTLVPVLQEGFWGVEQNGKKIDFLLSYTHHKILEMTPIKITKFKLKIVYNLLKNLKLNVIFSL